MFSVIINPITKSNENHSEGLRVTWSTLMGDEGRSVEDWLRVI
jgi:hypothetical protein